MPPAPSETNKFWRMMRQDARAQDHGNGQIGEIADHQRHIRSFQRHIGARRHQDNAKDCLHLRRSRQRQSP